VYDAVGVRVDQVPITPDLVLKALERTAKGKPGRVGPAGFPQVPWPEALIVPPPWEGGDGRAVNEKAASRDVLPTRHSGTAGVRV